MIDPSDIDSSLTRTETFASTSTVPGIGYLAGKAIRGLGTAVLKFGLDPIIIRRRLVQIESLLNDESAGLSFVTDDETIFDDLFELCRSAYNQSIRSKAFCLIMGKIGSMDIERLAATVVELPLSDLYLLFKSMFLCFNSEDSGRRASERLSEHNEEKTGPTRSYYALGLQAYTLRLPYINSSVDLPISTRCLAFILFLGITISLSSTPALSTMLLQLDVIGFLSRIEAPHPAYGLVLLALKEKLDPIRDILLLRQVPDISVSNITWTFGAYSDGTSDSVATERAEYLSDSIRFEIAGLKWSANQSGLWSYSIMKIPSIFDRRQALKQLLASERAYASGLALLKNFISMATGDPPELANATNSSTSFSGSSTSSSSSLLHSSGSSAELPSAPMSSQDVRIIFNNIAELELLSKTFCERLQEALGANIEGGVGKDSVGGLFLRTIPEWQKPYGHYISRQGAANEHLLSLMLKAPNNPALKAYFILTRESSKSVLGCDMYTLLQTPVRQLFKYLFLLDAILERSHSSHPDRKSLEFAKGKLEVLIHSVSEDRRCAETVRRTLMDHPSKILPRSNFPILLASTVNVGATNDLQETQSGDSDPSEAAHVQRIEDEFKEIAVFAYQFAQDVVNWATSTSLLVQGLITWAISFGKALGLSTSSEVASESFEAFLGLVKQKMVPSCLRLEAVINKTLLKDITQLIATMQQPRRLLQAMHEQKPSHDLLLAMHVGSKNRPPPVLVHASTNYLALRKQLSKEFPAYLKLMYRGIAISVRRLIYIQTQFWRDMQSHWSELWEALHVDGEATAGVEEIADIWKARWAEVDEAVKSLAIIHKPKDVRRPLGPVVSWRTPAKHDPNVGSVEKQKSQSLRLSSEERTNDILSTTSTGSSSYLSLSELLPVKKLSYVNDSTFDSQLKDDLRENDYKLRSLFGRQKLGDTLRPTGASKGLIASISAPLLSDQEVSLPAQISLQSAHRHRKDASSDIRPQLDPMRWFTASFLYAVQVVHPCEPPAQVSYLTLPFFTLVKNDVYSVLREAGHPNIHPNLPLHVGDQEDCLLLCRDGAGGIGWALASFLEPIGSPISKTCLIYIPLHSAPEFA